MATKRSSGFIVDIAQCLYVARGHRVILERDLELLFGVRKIRLRDQAEMNLNCFPDDFAFKLTASEFDGLYALHPKMNIGTGRGKTPWAFTEHGVLIMAGLIDNKRAVQAGIGIVREFVALRSGPVQNPALI